MQAQGRYVKLHNRRRLGAGLGPTMGEHFGQPAMQTATKRETACWGDVLQRANLSSLESDTIWHRSNRDPEAEFIRTAWLTVEQLPETAFESPLFTVTARDQWIRSSGKYQGTVEVSWFESGTFDRLADAQLFGDWAVERWHAAGTFGASGMTLRFDLDPNGNPEA